MTAAVAGFVRKRGGTWTAYWEAGFCGGGMVHQRSTEACLGGERRKSSRGGFRLKTEAQQFLRDTLGRIDRGEYVDPSRLTVGQYLTDRWLPAVRPNLKPTTARSYEQIVRLHVVPRIGAILLQRLNRGQVAGLRTAMRADGARLDRKPGPLSAKTVHYTMLIVHCALADAVADGLLAVNPADAGRERRRGRANPSAGRPEMSYWTAGELRKFLASVESHHHYAAWFLAAHTGMRRGELLGLRSRDVDLDAGHLSVRQTLVSVGYKPQLQPTAKTDGSARTVDLDERTVAVLRARRARLAADRLAIGPAYRDLDLVFSKIDGSLLIPDNFSQAFDRAVRRCDVPRIRLHDLRHTHATLLLKAGVPLKIVSERLGHASPAFTMSVYQHVLPGMGAEAAATFAALVDGSR